ncbi:hypothetical protein VD0002_g6228 [Verticillium dahliae]|nr:hypothetical protein VD0002_g6228 [Verticillium dahliae]RBQ99865.1 hypothetical protein VDGD_20062 [Verticillium dahliae]
MHCPYTPGHVRIAQIYVEGADSIFRNLNRYF